MKRLVLPATLLLSALGISSSPITSTCSAATLIYDESNQGDFPPFPTVFPTNPLPDFVLPLGQSIVKGEQVAPETPGDTEDWFLFEVPEDMRVDGAEFVFDISRLPEAFGRLPDDRYRLYLVEDGTERLVLDFVIQQTTDAGDPVPLPLDDGDPPAGKLDEGLYGMRFNVDEPAPYGVPYVVTFQVTEIPEPASVTLIISVILIPLTLRKSIPFSVWF